MYLAFGSCFFVAAVEQNEHLASVSDRGWPTCFSGLRFTVAPALCLLARTKYLSTWWLGLWIRSCGVNAGYCFLGTGGWTSKRKWKLSGHKLNFSHKQGQHTEFMGSNSTQTRSWVWASLTLSWWPPVLFTAALASLPAWCPKSPFPAVTSFFWQESPGGQNCLQLRNKWYKLRVDSTDSVMSRGPAFYLVLRDRWRLRVNSNSCFCLSVSTSPSLPQPLRGPLRTG